MQCNIIPYKQTTRQNLNQNMWDNLIVIIHKCILNIYKLSIENKEICVWLMFVLTILLGNAFYISLVVSHEMVPHFSGKCICGLKSRVDSCELHPLNAMPCLEKILLSFSDKLLHKEWQCSSVCHSVSPYLVWPSFLCIFSNLIMAQLE